MPLNSSWLRAARADGTVDPLSYHGGAKPVSVGYYPIVASVWGELKTNRT
jgi:hypothetical protein